MNQKTVKPGWQYHPGLINGQAEPERSAEPDLGEDALTSEQLGAEANHKAEHGQTAIPSLSEGNETKTGSVVSHGRGGCET